MANSFRRYAPALASERALPADEPVADAALALCAVTGGALLSEYFAPVTDAADSRRQVAAVAADIDIPPRNLRRRRGPADAVRALRLCTRRP